MTTFNLRAWRDLTSRLYRQNEFTIKLGLDAMRRALALSGHPEQSQPAILIAGTNGKGTIAACLTALLQEHGVRVGLYSSPHLLGFEERFRVEGAPIEREEVFEVAQRVMDAFAAEERDPRLTFFELTTLMAVELFAREELDVALYEVGIGGRLDATNAIEPAMGVIATIGFDHQAMLGESLEEIAGEKLGIHREGVPLIVGAQEYPEVEQFFGESAPEAIFAREPLCDVTDWGVLRAPYQQRHFWTAAYAARAHLGHDLEEGAVRRAARAVRWPGRLHRLTHSLASGTACEVFLDGAHNKDGVRALFEHLDEIGWAPDVILCGAMKNKDLVALFEPLARLEHDAMVYGVRIENERAADEALLASVLPARARIMTTREAIASLERASAKRALVFGSLYLVGEVLQALGVSSSELVTWARGA